MPLGQQRPCICPCDFKRLALLPRHVTAAVTVGDAFGLLYQGLADPALLKHKPSLTAAAMLASGRCAAGIVPFWPATLDSLTGYREQHAADFGSAMAAVGNLMTVVYSSGELLTHHSY